MQTYSGGCHCGRVRFEVTGVLDRISDCNCSICSKAGYLHWMIEPSQLKMLTPWESLSTYVWGTRAARHYFCPVCGVAVLRKPRSQPDKISVNARCVDRIDLAKVSLGHTDGRSFSLPQD